MTAPAARTLATLVHSLDSIARAAQCNDRDAYNDAVNTAQTEGATPAQIDDALRYGTRKYLGSQTHWTAL